ncbi:MAG: hypothetical protein WCS52_15025 [bacterium]
MNQKDKAHHVVKAATKAAINDGKAAEDKADIKLALVAYQVACDQKKHTKHDVIRVNWQNAIPTPS